MRVYWPCASVMEENTVKTISTYDSTSDLDTAMEQRKIWENIYHSKMVAFWIDVYEYGSKVDRLAVFLR